MKNHYHILIIEPSYIIREGLNTIIQHLSTDITVDLFSSYKDFTDHNLQTNYDLILINTSEFDTHSLSKNKYAELFNGTTVLGILSTMGRRFIINQLNDVIYINDSEEQILEIINKNLKKNKGIKPVNQILTERETDVLKLLVKGNTSKEIAEKLFISTHTVITHRKNITVKLGIKTTAALAIYAVTANILDEEDILRESNHY